MFSDSDCKRMLDCGLLCSFAGGGCIRMENSLSPALPFFEADFSPEAEVGWVRPFV